MGTTLCGALHAKSSKCGALPLFCTDSILEFILMAPHFCGALHDAEYNYVKVYLQIYVTSRVHPVENPRQRGGGLPVKIVSFFFMNPAAL